MPAAQWIDRDDLRVAGAAADLAGDRLADLRVGRVRVASSSARAVSIIPGVQKPHCRPCSSMKPCCTGSSTPSTSSPSTVRISCPAAIAASTVHDLTGSPSISTTHVAAVGGVTAPVRAGQAELVAQEVDEQHPRLDVAGRAPPVDRHRHLHLSLLSERPRGRPAQRAPGQLARRGAACTRPSRADRSTGEQSGGREPPGLGEQLLGRRLAARAPPRRRLGRDLGADRGQRRSRPRRSCPPVQPHAGAGGGDGPVADAPLDLLVGAAASPGAAATRISISISPSPTAVS